MIKKFIKVGMLLELLWHALHFLITIWYLVRNVARVMKSYLISSKLLKRYRTLNLSKLQYLAIVVDSEEALQTSMIVTLLQRLAAIGLKHICLYDMEGVMKKSKETILAGCNATLWKESNGNESLVNQRCLTLEFASMSDGKEALAEAANFLFMKLKRGNPDADQEKPIFTESIVTDALKAIGCGGPDPDLLLVFGPIRCYLGFPAWRIRYTEIVHMGPLKSVRYGSLIKAIQKFTRVQQNFGT